MRTNLLAFGVAILASHASLAAQNGVAQFEKPQPYEFTQPAPMEGSMTIEGGRFWVGIDGNVGATFGLFGGSFTAGYQGHYLGGDVRFSFNQAKYGAISALPSASDQNVPVDPDAISVISRGTSDSWSYMLFEPGVAVAGRLFTEILPLLTEKARFGLGYGPFQNQTTSTSFSGFLASAEGTLQYQPGARSPFSIEGSVAWHFGQLNLNGQPGSQNAISLSFVTMSLGVLYWF